MKATVAYFLNLDQWFLMFLGLKHLARHKAAFRKCQLLVVFFLYYRKREKILCWK